MDENHQDNAESKLAVIEDTKWVLNKKNKLWIPQKNNTHKWRNLRAGFFKLWATPVGIGTVIAVGTLLWGVISFTIQQQLAQLQAERQFQSDQQRVIDQQEETTLQTYIDNIQDLLLNHHLLNSKSTDNVALIARVRTLTTLRRLNAERNRILLRFLQDAHLIGIPNAVINLNGANLSGANLSGANLSGANLNGAILNGANLNGAILNGANLNGAILNRANLNGADLSNADLSDAFLNGTDLSYAFLNETILSYAALNGADLNAAILIGANLSSADLSNATLNGADLSGANLSSADLSAAILNGADLSDAELSNVALLTQLQLDTVSSCTNAIFPSTGLTCHHIGSIISLTYWYTEVPAETPVILQRIRQFEQQNPHIKIHAVYKPFSPARVAFITATQTDNAPDILRSDVSWVPQFASQGYLLNLDPFVHESGLSGYLSAPLSSDQYNGHLYGLPQATDFLALLYNKAELAKAVITSPPATMADFEADAMKIVQSKAAPYGFETSGGSYYMLPFLYAFGGGMIDQYKNILVNSPGSVAGLKFLLKLQNSDKVMPAQVDFSNGYANMVNDFKSGKTAMIFDGPWDISYILTGSAFQGNPSNLGIAAVPMGPSGDQPRSPTGGQSYVISARTAHPAEAYKFISFMSSTESQVAITEENHTLPTRNSAYQDPSVSSDPVIRAFYSMQNTAVGLPAIPQGRYLFNAFDPNILAALNGTESPADALNAVAEIWKELLAS